MWNLKPYLPMVQTNKICVDIFICIAERTTTTTTLKIMLDRSISALDVLMVSFVSDGRNLPTNVTTHIWCLLCNLTTKSSLKYSSFPNCFFFFFFFWPKGQHRFTTTPTTVLFSGVWFDRTYLSLSLFLVVLIMHCFVISTEWNMAGLVYIMSRIMYKSVVGWLLSKV